MSASEGNSGNESGLGGHAMRYSPLLLSLWSFPVQSSKPFSVHSCRSAVKLTLSPHVTCLFWLYRKREARRLFLTMKINLQFYYIPVRSTTSPISPTKVGHLDPLCRLQLCPDNNINTLGLK